MDFQPKPYQVLGRDWLESKPSAALFAGMGLGKTAMTLAALDRMFCGGEIKGALIIAPLRVSVLTWPNEIRKWSQFSWMRTALLRTEEGREAWREGSADIYLLNYEQIPKFLKECVHGRRKTQMPAQVVVWDELSKAKSPSSKRINTFRKYRERFDYHWGLTGTPRPNGYLDLFAQCRLLDNGQRLGKAFTHFRDAYFRPDNPFSDYPKFIPMPGTAGKVNKRISDLALVLRSEDYLNVPTIFKNEIQINLPKKAQRIYDELQKEFLTELENGMEISAPTSAAKMQKLLQITSGAVYDEQKRVGSIHNEKLKTLKKLYRQRQGPLLVGTSFIHEKDRILEAIPGAETFRDDTLERWEAREIPMLVAHPLEIGHGVDGLQSVGRDVVWFSPLWSSELYDQFNSRIIRMGQEHETTIHHIICPGTVDDAVMDVLRGKGDEQTDFLDAVKNLQKLARVA